MSQKPGHRLSIDGRKILFLAYLLPLVFPIIALYLAETTGKYNHFGWWLLVASYIPFFCVDQLFGKDRGNLTGDQLKRQEKSFYYSFLPFLGVTASILLSLYGADYFSRTNELIWVGQMGWIISLGLVILALSLSTGHELIHREKRFEKLIGSFSFAYMCNAAYKIIHIRGHHVHAATPADIGFIRFNQSLYHYLPRALKNTFVNAWLIEKNRLNCKGIPVLSWRNEFISWHLVSLGIIAIFYFLFGMIGAIFYLGHGLIALIATHIINYIQHYGLERRKRDDGCYEKFSAAHAWNCNFLISNAVALGLPRHTDHHLKPRRPYPLLRHVEESPQMPMGYFGMFLMVLIPSLWFKVMNPRIQLYDQKGPYFKR